MLSLPQCKSFNSSHLSPAAHPLFSNETFSRPISVPLTPVPLSLAFCLLQPLPSTQDLPEMCRLWLLGNTSVQLKLQMESSQSRGMRLVDFSVGRAYGNVVPSGLYTHAFLKTNTLQLFSHFGRASGRETLYV